MSNRGGKREGAGRKAGKMNNARVELAVESRKHRDVCLKTWVDCMKDPNAPWQARNDAAEKIMCRGFGKAPQEIIIEEGIDDPAADQPRGISELLGMAEEAIRDGEEDTNPASSED